VTPSVAVRHLRGIAAARIRKKDRALPRMWEQRLACVLGRGKMTVRMPTGGCLHEPLRTWAPRNRAVRASAGDYYQRHSHERLMVNFTAPSPGKLGG
jgi:hypothetical protein